MNERGPTEGGAPFASVILTKVSERVTLVHERSQVQDHPDQLAQIESIVTMVVTDSPPPGDTAVVLLSNDALLEEGYQQVLRDLSHNRIVTIALEDVAWGLLPEMLRKIQWIRAGHLDLEGELRQVLAFSDAEGQATQALHRKQAAWQASGGRSGLLLQDRAGIRLLERHLAHEPGTPEDELFLHLSRHELRKRQLKTVGRGAWWTFLIGVLVFGVLQVRAELAYSQHKSTVSLLLSASPEVLTGQPDGQALKLGGLLDEEMRDGRETSQPILDQFAALLSFDFIHALHYVSPSGVHFFSSALSGDARASLVVADAFGGVYRVENDAFVELGATGHRSISLISVPDGGRGVCGVSGTDGFILHERTVTNFALPAAATAVVVSPGGESCLFGTAEGAFAGDVGGGAVTQVSPYAVVTGARVEGNPAFLVRGDGDQLGMLTDKVVWIGTPPIEVEEFAVATDGAVYAAGINEALWVNQDDAWVSTGVPVPGVPTLLSPFSGGVIIETTHRPAFAYHSTLSRVTEGVCPLSAPNLLVHVDNAGETLVCHTGTVLSISTPRFPREAATLFAGPRNPSFPASAMIRDGTVLLTTEAGTTEVHPETPPFYPSSHALTGSPTAVHVDAPGMLIGYDNGLLASLVIDRQGRHSVGSVYELALAEPVEEIHWDKATKATQVKSAGVWWDAVSCPTCRLSSNYALGEFKNRARSCYPVIEVLDAGFSLSEEYLEALGVRQCDTGADHE